MVVAAGEKVAEFMGQQNAQERECKRDTRYEQPWFEEVPEVIEEEVIKPGRHAGSVSCSELCAGGEGRERSDCEKTDGHDERAKGTSLGRPNKRTRRQPWRWLRSNEFYGNRFR